MKYDQADLREALAASYVLGTLRGAARRRFVRLLSTDRSLSPLIEKWENFLTPLAARVEPIEPPERVWRAIEARIARSQPLAQPRKAGWWDSLAFWRNWGLAATGLAAALMIATIVIKPQPPADSAMVAVLSTPENVPRMIVEKHAGMLKVKVVKAWASLPENDLELWVVPKSGAPRSLGVVSHARDSEVRKGDLDNLLADGAAFAISKEPKGGSPSGAPTGPILCSGAIAKMPVRT
ncbi:MAG: anti-sigma factor [Betaproteobacteria bacterium]|nr:anti-sigma factor [Betaproteobacteria bacterium]